MGWLRRDSSPGRNGHWDRRKSLPPIKEVIPKLYQQMAAVIFCKCNFRHNPKCQKTLISYLQEVLQSWLGIKSIRPCSFYQEPHWQSHLLLWRQMNMGSLIRSRTTWAHKPDSEHNIWDTTAVGRGSWRCITPRRDTNARHIWWSQLTEAIGLVLVDWWGALASPSRQPNIDIIILYMEGRSPWGESGVTMYWAGKVASGQAISSAKTTTPTHNLFWEILHHRPACFVTNGTRYKRVTQRQVLQAVLWVLCPILESDAIRFSFDEFKSNTYKKG